MISTACDASIHIYDETNRIGYVIVPTDTRSTPLSVLVQSMHILPPLQEQHPRAHDRDGHQQDTDRHIFMVIYRQDCQRANMRSKHEWTITTYSLI